MGKSYSRVVGRLAFGSGAAHSPSPPCSPSSYRYTSEAVEALAEGELLQLKRMREASLTPEAYYEVIDKKTAALFQATAKDGRL
jgi:geranylgeranyl pyrophosphate synthase